MHWLVERSDLFQSHQPSFIIISLAADTNATGNLESAATQKSAKLRFARAYDVFTRIVNLLQRHFLLSSVPRPIKIKWAIQTSTGDLTIYLTVLSGAEERGVDGPSLDCFSRLQPISFIFFEPFSSHIAKLVARTRYSISMLHEHATHAGLGKRLKCFDPSTWSRFEVSNAAEEVVFTANVVCV